MAKELYINLQGDLANVYAIIRKISDSTVWNGSAFVAWADGDIANYDVALTARGGDLYDTDFPTAIAAGNYQVSYHKRAGGSPATTDYWLGGARLYWSGSAASSVSSVTISPYAHATLDQVKQDLGITDSASDTALTEDINQVTAFNERVMRGRRIKARNWRERLDGTHQQRLILKQYPAITLTRIAYGFANAFSLTYTGAGIRANAAIYNDYSSDTSGGMKIVSVDTSGVPTVTDLSFATYRSVNTLITAIDAVSGWNATEISNQPTCDLNPIAMGNALNRTVHSTYPDQVWEEHVVNYQSGIVQLQWQAFPYHNAIVESRTPVRFPLGFQSLLVEYRAGYEAIPDDINMVAREIIRKKYYERQTDPSITSITLGPYSATFDRDDEAFVEARIGYYADESRLIG